MLVFNDYVKIIVTRDNKNQRFKFYEEEAKPENITILQPYFSKVRLEKYKNGDIEYFKKLFNDTGCLPGELVL